MNVNKRKKALAEFVEKYGDLCRKYDCAIELHSMFDLVDFVSIRELPDYREGEIEEGIEKQRKGLLANINYAVGTENYVHEEESYDD
jgi:hypothetical protein